jgi:hypothetical protein
VYETFEDGLYDCRYEQERCAAEMLVDEEAAALGIGLSSSEREDAVEELLDTGVMVRFEESRGGDSYTSIADPADRLSGGS